MYKVGKWKQCKTSQHIISVDRAFSNINFTFILRTRTRLGRMDSWMRTLMQGASQWQGTVVTACHHCGNQGTMWPGLTLPVRGRHSTTRTSKVIVLGLTALQSTWLKRDFASRWCLFSDCMWHCSDWRNPRPGSCLNVVPKERPLLSNVAGGSDDGQLDRQVISMSWLLTRILLLTSLQVWTQKRDWDVQEQL